MTFQYCAVFPPGYGQWGHVQADDFEGAWERCLVQLDRWAPAGRIKITLWDKGRVPQSQTIHFEREKA